MLRSPNADMTLRSRIRLGQQEPYCETPQGRFARKVLPLPSGCWRWTGTIEKHGYGSFSLSGKGLRAHRLSYMWHVGPIPEGMQLDHLCRNKWCVNPAHLEPVTARENTLRGVGPGALAVRSNRCKYGHSMADAYIKPDGRHCRTCSVERSHAKYLARKAALEALS